MVVVAVVMVVAVVVRPYEIEDDLEVHVVGCNPVGDVLVDVVRIAHHVNRRLQHGERNNLLQQLHCELEGGIGVGKGAGGGRTRNR